MVSTPWGLAPAEIAREAAVWRRSWGVIVGNSGSSPAPRDGRSERPGPEGGHTKNPFTGLADEDVVGKPPYPP